MVIFNADDRFVTSRVILPCDVSSSSSTIKSMYFWEHAFRPVCTNIWALMQLNVAMPYCKDVPLGLSILCLLEHVIAPPSLFNFDTILKIKQQIWEQYKWRDRNL